MWDSDLGFGLVARISIRKEGAVTEGHRDGAAAINPALDHWTDTSGRLLHGPFMLINAGCEKHSMVTWKYDPNKVHATEGCGTYLRT